jgi:crotonobetainyl-CoA:carnitine CoA-transferase CaiB-like acyl-CoA transferase
VLGDGMFAKVARLVGHPEWIDDPRFATDNDRADNGEALSAGVAAWCIRYTNAEALKLLRDARLPGAPVNSLQQALEEPQLAALGMLQDVPHPGRANLQLFKSPIVADGEFATIRSRPPLAGEHTDAILGELGYSATQIAALHRAHTIGFHP